MAIAPAHADLPTPKVSQVIMCPLLLNKPSEAWVGDKHPGAQSTLGDATIGGSQEGRVQESFQDSTHTHETYQTNGV